MMSLRLIARWGQPLYELVSSTSVGLAPGGAGPSAASTPVLDVVQPFSTGL